MSHYIKPNQTGQNKAKQNRTKDIAHACVCASPGSPARVSSSSQNKDFGHLATAAARNLINTLLAQIEIWLATGRKDDRTRGVSHCLGVCVCGVASVEG